MPIFLIPLLQSSLKIVTITIAMAVTATKILIQTMSFIFWKESQGRTFFHSNILSQVKGDQSQVWCNNYPWASSGLCFFYISHLCFVCWLWFLLIGYATWDKLCEKSFTWIKINLQSSCLVRMCFVYRTNQWLFSLFCI